MVCSHHKKLQIKTNINLAIHYIPCYMLLNLDVMEFTRMDLDQLHDLIFNALEIDIKDDSEIKKYWEKLPNNIKKDFEHWGMGDTPTRDNAYVWLQANCI